MGACASKKVGIEPHTEKKLKDMERKILQIEENMLGIGEKVNSLKRRKNLGKATMSSITPS